MNDGGWERNVKGDEQLPELSSHLLEPSIKMLAHRCRLQNNGIRISGGQGLGPGFKAHQGMLMRSQGCKLPKIGRNSLTEL